MTGIYYTQAAEWLRVAGLTVVETDGWKTRARSTGGFAARPLGVFWHHTAGNMNLQSNLWWETEGSDVAPIGNMLLWPDGVIYMIAAGAANTAGKGGPVTFSRGTVPVDRGNTTTWNIEAGNNGTGQPWPQVQIDAYFKASNELNFKFGNSPTDLVTHASYAPRRKIDPAKASAVLGPWQPSPTTTSGTWDCDDVRAEAQRRWAGVTPPPRPTPDSTEDRMLYLIKLDTNPNLYMVGDGITSRRVRSDEIDEMTNALTKGIGPEYRNPTKPDRPVIRAVADIPTGSDDFLQLLGVETAESIAQT